MERYMTFLHNTQEGQVVSSVSPTPSEGFRATEATAARISVLERPA
jgi:hypothetical protein